MGLLEDVVKLQYGVPMREALVSIGAGIRESEAQSRIAPLIADLETKVKSLPTITVNTPDGATRSIPDPDATSRLMTQALTTAQSKLGATLLETDTFKNFARNTESISKSILEGVRTGGLATAEYTGAQANRARALEQTAETTFADKLLPAEFQKRYFPNEYKPITWRQASEMSRIETPYIQAAIAKDEAAYRNRALGAAQRAERDNQVLEFKTAYLAPSLGYDITNMGEKVDQYIIDNDWNGLAKGILKSSGVSDNDPKWDEKYKAIRNKIMNAVDRFGMTKTKFGQYLVQMEQSYQRYIQAYQNNPINWTPNAKPPMSKEEYMDHYFRQMEGNQGQPAPAGAPQPQAAPQSGIVNPAATAVPSAVSGATNAVGNTAGDFFGIRPSAPVPTTPINADTVKQLLFP